jgi:hypothetical protein
MALAAAPLSAAVAGSGSTVTATGPATSPLARATFHISGTVSPATPGTTVRLQRRVEGRFQRVGTATLSAGGSYDFARRKPAGRYAYRVKAPATPTESAGFSAAVHVVVVSRFARASVVRAQSWVDQHVPYSQSARHTNRFGTYRQDCSGYVSMAWALSSSYTTATLPSDSFAIGKSALRRGDVLVHQATRSASGHVVLFDQWANSGHTSYLAYEETPSGGASHHDLPYPYWSGHGTYAPYRRDGT